MFRLLLEKAEKPEIKWPTCAGSSKKQESSRKTSISALLTMPKPLTVWITINCGKFWKRWEYQTTLSASWEICMQVRKQQLELDMEQQFSSVVQSCPTLCNPCLSPTPRVYSNSCPLSQWCHPTVLSSVILFSRLQSFPTSGSFQMSQFFTSGSQSIGISASTSVLPMNMLSWS